MSSFKAMTICHYEPIGKNDPPIFPELPCTSAGSVKSPAQARMP